jgi:hypothetical protein
MREQPWTRVIVPARLWRRGHGPGDHEGRGTPREPCVGQITRGIRSPRRPRHRPGLVPGRCRLSRRGVFRRPGPAPACQAVSARRTHLRNPLSAPWPSSRPASSWAGPQVAQGQPRSGSARGHFRTRRAKHRPVSRPPPRHAPYRARRPGRWRLRATDAGTALTHGPARSATGRAPEGRPRIAPEAPWTGAARKHKIGTLSRQTEPRAARCGPPLPAVIAGPRRVSEIPHRRRPWIAGSPAAPRNDGLLPGTAIRGRSKAAHPRPAPLQPPSPPADRPDSNRPSA